VELPNRDKGFDAFRGIAILGVILIHAASAGYGMQDMTGHSWNFWYTVFLRCNS